MVFDSVRVTPGLTPSSYCASAVFEIDDALGLAATRIWNWTTAVWAEARVGNPKAISSTLAGGGATVT